MADVLTDKAIFICNSGAVIQCKDSGNGNVKYDGATLLTTDATVKSKKGICAILTSAAQGVPQPCKCQLTAWIAPGVGYSTLKTSNGKPLLNSSVKNICAVGGNISVQTSGVFGHITVI